MTKHSFVALLVAVQIIIPPVASTQHQSPALEFPVQGLDDMAAYRNYQTRFYRDASNNTIQVVLNQEIGRVVNLWADAANESMSFSVRDSGNTMPRFSWGSPGADDSTDGTLRTLQYRLTVHSPVVRFGHFLLGSMRVERDFQYAKRERLPLDSLPPVEPELLQLLANFARLPAEERDAQLTLLRASNEDEVAARLRPHQALLIEGGRWSFTARQRTMDGLNHFLLQISDDTARSHAAFTDGILTVRSRTGANTLFTVRIGTDSPALSPLTRNDIFTPEFEQLYSRMEAESSHSGGEGHARFRLLERQVKSMELLSSKEKLMAGLPNYATYFGRDMMMSAMMLESVLKPAMQEHVISAVLRKLSAEGKVSHEEALGGQAIREHAALYNRLIGDFLRDSTRRNSPSARQTLQEARAILARLQTVREDYHMVDETLQLPVITARYLARSDISMKAKKVFLLDTLDGTTRLERLMRNLRYVEQSSAAFVARQDVVNLVSFPRRDDGTWISASWRDSGAGYAGGRFAMDVNAIWMPAALSAMKIIFEQLDAMKISRAELNQSLPRDGEGSNLRRYARHPSDLDDPIRLWEGTKKFFEVRFGAEEVRKRVEARLAALPDGERAYWQRLLPAVVGHDSLTFLALSLDSLGKPIPVMNTDPATWLFLADLAGGITEGEVNPREISDLIRTFVLPYPVGLFVTGLGALVANDVYAAPGVWEGFERDQYHSPRVVWGREVNLILLGTMKLLEGLRSPEHAQRMASSAGLIRDLSDALSRIRTAVDTSGMKQNELWTYKIAGGMASPARYEFTCDIQLWNLTDLAVQFEYDRLKNRGQDSGARGRTRH